MKNMLKRIIGILLIIVLMLYTNVSIANNDYTSEQNQKNENNKKINEIKEKEKELENIKDSTLKEVEKLNIEINEYQKQIDVLNDEISDTNKKISDAEEKLKKSQEDYEKQEELLKARLVAAYEAGETSYLDVLLSSESITDFISNYYLISEVATYDSELLDKIEKEKQAIANAKETLEQSKRELDTKKASKQSATLQLQTSKNSKNKYVSELTEEQKGLQAKIDQLRKDNESLDAAISAKKAAIEAWKRQQNSGGSSNNGGSSSNYSGSKSSSGFIKPVNSYVTTGMYYSSGGYHGAVDFGASGVNGMPVYAVADGYVVMTRALTTSYGNYIIIAHPNGLYTLYAHGQAGSICVSEGQTVKQGQQIMRVGSTGNSSGPHLHFEVRTSPGTYSCRVNPLSYLP
ncbi:MAG: peptidoglycan DD-metalloendopeptidase family protein [Clostridia bacterium]|nr:peptidoglycan DD-metalloendopeptidase family protein [Clostridia bacterium]